MCPSRFGVVGGEEGVAGGLEKPSCEPAAPGLGCLLGGEGSALSLKVGAWRAWASAWAWGLGCFGEAGSHPQTWVQGEETSACLCCPTPARQALAPEMGAEPGFELSGRRQVLGGLSAVSQQLSWDGPDQAVRSPRCFREPGGPPPHVSWAGMQAAGRGTRQGTWAFRACAHQCAVAMTWGGPGASEGTGLLLLVAARGQQSAPCCWVTHILWVVASPTVDGGVRPLGQGRGGEAARGRNGPCLPGASCGLSHGSCPGWREEDHAQWSEHQRQSLSLELGWAGSSGCGWPAVHLGAGGAPQVPLGQPPPSWAGPAEQAARGLQGIWAHLGHLGCDSGGTVGGGQAVLSALLCTGQPPPGPPPPQACPAPPPQAWPGSPSCCPSWVACARLMLPVAWMPVGPQPQTQEAETGFLFLSQPPFPGRRRLPLPLPCAASTLPQLWGVQPLLPVVSPVLTPGTL